MTKKCHEDKKKDFQYATHAWSCVQGGIKVSLASNYMDSPRTSPYFRQFHPFTVRMLCAQHNTTYLLLHNTGFIRPWSDDRRSPENIFLSPQGIKQGPSLLQAVQDMHSVCRSYAFLISLWLQPSREKILTVEGAIPASQRHLCSPKIKMWSIVEFLG